MSDDLLLKLINLIEQDKISELEAERFINAATRLDARVPTGISRVPNNQYTHTHKDV